MIELQNEIHYRHIEAMYRQNGYRFFKGAYNCNFFGIRNREAGQTRIFHQTDKFDDLIGVAFEDKHKNGIVIIAVGTVDPGLQSLVAPVFIEQIKNGALILAEDYYPSVYTLEPNGWGYWNYPVLRQTGNFRGFRDNNKNQWLDLEGVQQEGKWFGAGLHTTKKGYDPVRIGPWGAGCQVVEHYEDHQAMMKPALMQSKLGLGNKCSYGLFAKPSLLAIL